MILLSTANIQLLLQMLFLLKNVSVSFSLTIQRGEETGCRLLSLLCIFETLLAMQAGLDSSQRLVSAIHMHTQKKPSTTLSVSLSYSVKMHPSLYFKMHYCSRLLKILELLIGVWNTSDPTSSVNTTA